MKVSSGLDMGKWGNGKMGEWENEEMSEANKKKAHASVQF